MMQTEHIIILSVLGLVVLLSIGNLLASWKIGHDLYVKIDDTNEKVSRMAVAFDNTRNRLCTAFPGLCPGPDGQPIVNPVI